MIMKFLPLAEVFGWFGLVLFILNEIILITSYSMLIINKKKMCISIPFLVMNILLTLLSLALFILFIILLVNPQILTSQGKLDPRTITYFIVFSIVLLAVSLVHLLLTIFLQPYFGAYEKNKKIYISLIDYSKNDFTLKNKTISFGKKRHNKKISLKSKTAKFIVKEFDF